MITATFPTKQAEERLEFAEDNLRRIEAKGLIGTKEHEEARQLYREVLTEYNAALSKYRA